MDVVRTVVPKGTPNRKKKQIRADVYARDCYTCQECGATKDQASLTLDHIIPKSKGGQFTRENLRVLCYPCNQEKDDKNPWELTSRRSGEPSSQAKGP